MCGRYLVDKSRHVDTYLRLHHVAIRQEKKSWYRFQLVALAKLGIVIHIQLDEGKQLVLSGKLRENCVHVAAWLCPRRRKVDSAKC